MPRSVNKGVMAVAALAGTTMVSGFTTQNTMSTTFSLSQRQKMNRNDFAMRMSDSPDEVAELLAAAAKMREEANRMAKEMGKEIEDTTVKTKKPEKLDKKSLNAEEILSLTSEIDFLNGDSSSQAQKLDELVSTGNLSKWKSATKNLRTYPVSLNFLESRSDGKLTAERLGVGGEDDVSLDDFKYATLWVTGGSSLAAIGSLAFLPENIGSTLCYLFALIPIIFLGIGSSAPGIIAGAIQATRGSNDDEQTRIERICRHEAGHFLCGYLCGLPVKNYEITDTGFPCVEFHPSTEINAITGKREFSREEIAALSVVALSGSVAEALKFEQAKGGDNDLLELDGLFRRSEEFIGAAKQQDLTRWGALASYQIMKENMDTYEKLVIAFKEKKSVSECIAVIESN